MVGRIASAYEARPALAEELVQDVFAALWRALPNYRGDASMRTFVARVAHNVCVSHVRREARTTHADLDDDIPCDAESPEAQADHNIARQRLLRAVRELPLGQRQAVTLHLEGFSDRDVADALGITEGNAAVRLTRARARLKETMGAIA